MVKIACIADTHHKFEKIEVPKCDILLHAGDCLYDGTYTEWVAFLVWFSTQPAKHKILIPGNHDFYIQNNPKKARAAAALMDIIILIDEEITVEGLRIYGTPWCPKLKYWAYYADDKKLAAKAKAIPLGVDIVLTHSPAYGVLDQVGLRKTGWTQLTKRLKVVKPQLHVCGHIHEGYGERLKNGIIHINASSCNVRYKPINAPVEIELAPREPDDTD